jgi:hypothetical protein
MTGKRSAKRILNYMEWRLEADRNGKRASQKSACPGKPVEIAELIASYRQSGQRQREFCQQRGIGLSTLQNYQRRERTKGQQKHRRLLEVEVVAKTSTVARETPPLGRDLGLSGSALVDLWIVQTHKKGFLVAAYGLT